MSRDQRPARTVMIAPDASSAPPQRRAHDTAAATSDPGAPTATAPVQSRTLLLSGLFLFACVAGAAGVALTPWLLAGR